MIRESLLPNLHVRSQFFLRLIREPAFDELNGFLKAREGRQDYMNVVGHDDEFVQEIRRATVMVESIDEQTSPRLSAKERTPTPRGGGNHVRMARVRGVLSGRSHVAF